MILAAYLLPGAHVTSFSTALIVAFLLAILNALLKPILVFLTLPVTIMSLGLFLLVINAVIILVIDQLVDGFNVDGFGWALGFSLIISLLSWLLGLKEK